MAAQSRRQELLKTKIECLFTRRDDLYQLIGDYVDQVTKVGQTWMDGQANTGLTFNNVRDFLETSLNFLFDVVDNISVAATSPSSSSMPQQSAARSASPTSSIDASPSSSMEEQMESIRHRMDTLETRGHSLQHVMSATQERVDKMEEKVDKTEEKVDKIEKKMEKMDKMEEKMDKTEEKAGKMEEKVDKREKKVDKIEEKMDKMEKEVNKMEEEKAKTLQNLEERQKVIDEEKTAKTQEMEKQLSQLEKGRVRMEKQTQSHEKTVSDLGMQVGGAAVGDRQQTESRQQIGFKAQLPNGQKVSITDVTILRCLTEVTMNTGHHYDVSTGVFTVPVSGRYQVTLTHSPERRGSEGGFIYLYVAHESGNVGIKEKKESLLCGIFHSGDQQHYAEAPEKQKMSTLLCGTGTHGSRYGLNGSIKVQGSSEEVVQLGVRDRLWVKVGIVWDCERLVSPTCFSCVLLDD